MCWEVYSFALLPYHDIEDNSQVKKFVMEGGTLKIPKLCPKQIWEKILKCFDFQPSSRPGMSELIEELSGFVSLKTNSTISDKMIDVLYT